MKKTNKFTIFTILILATINSVIVVSHSQPEKIIDYKHQISVDEIKYIVNKTVKIGLIDSGLNTSNKIVQNSIWKNNLETINGIDDDNNGYIDDINGWDFVEHDNNITDYSTDHGTNALLIIQDINPNTVFITARVLGNLLRTNSSNMVKAINYLIDLEVDIINLPISWDDLPIDVVNVVNKAYSREITIIGATGNDAKFYNRINDLAQLESVIAVGSVTDNSERSIFSQYGKGIEIVAPGENITDNYITGTSYSGAVVTGVVSILVSEDKENSLTNDKIRRILQRTATDLNDTGYDIFTGYGLINGTYALTVSRDYNLPEVKLIGNKTIITDDTKIFNVVITGPNLKFTENPMTESYEFDFSEVFENDTQLVIEVEDMAGNKIRVEHTFIVVIVKTINTTDVIYFISIIFGIAIIRKKS